MAFAAINCLIETLQDLLRLTYLALEIDSLHIEIADGKQLLDDSLGDSVQSVAENILIDWHPLALKYLRWFERNSTRLYLEEGSVNSMWTSLYILNVRAIETLDLYQNLRFLLTFLKDLASIWDEHEKLKYFDGSLVSIAYRIEDIIEESTFQTSIHSKAINFMNGVLNGDPVAAIEEIPNFLAEVHKMFDKMYGVQQHLQETVKEIDLIQREVKKFYDEVPIVTETLQVRQSTEIADSLQHMPAKKKGN